VNAGTRNRLDGFGTGARRLSTLGAGYSAFVRIAKFALPVMALVIIGAVGANLSKNPVAEQISQLPKEEETKPGQLTLTAARYEGIDDEGRNYTITADQATRTGDNDNVLLAKPKADLELDAQSWIALHADNGDYNMKRNILQLTNNVTLFHNDGYEMKTDALTINVGKKVAVSNKHVTGHGPIGEISGTWLKITDNGNLITFGGPARLILRDLGGKKG